MHFSKNLLLYKWDDISLNYQLNDPKTQNVSNEMLGNNSSQNRPVK